MPNNHTIALIKEYFGNDIAKYVENKDRGGSNGKKGSRYEDFYLVLKYAELSKLYIEQKVNYEIKEQQCCFVDDIVITLKNKTEHYQLKNSTNVSWGTNDKSIKSDFDNQYKLNTHQDITSKMILVVADNPVGNKLKSNMPDELKSFSEVEIFPYIKCFRNLIHDNKRIKDAIGYLCAFENDDDKLEATANALLGTLIATNGTSKISDLLKKAKNEFPSYIRDIKKSGQLAPKCANILDNIPDFTYQIKKGFLSWSYKNGEDSGVLNYNCSDNKFAKFQSLIIEKKPTQFIDIEEILL